MKRTAFLLAFSLLTAFLNLSCAPLITTSPKPKYEFAFVINCEWAHKGPGICLLGKHKQGIEVTLLEVGRPKTCRSETKEAVDHKDAVGNTLYSFTLISPVAGCRGPYLYSIAVLGSRISSYQIIKLQEISDKKKVQSLDKFVRNKNILEKLRKKAQGLGSEDYELPNNLPKVHRYPIPKIETIIVSYYGGFEVVSGPRVILINGVAYPLTGWCSYPYLRAFCLNGEYYLESGSCCCECGITIKELFKIEPTGLVQVHSDDSLSD